jgi:hypothetical protein
MVYLRRGVDFFNIIYLVFGVFYFSKYYYQRKKPYIIITDDLVKVHSIFKSRAIDIKDITEITFPFRDIIIKSKDQKFEISKDVIEEKDYILLEERLNSIKQQLAI